MCHFIWYFSSLISLVKFFRSSSFSVLSLLLKDHSGNISNSCFHCRKNQPACRCKFSSSVGYKCICPECAKQAMCTRQVHNVDEQEACGPRPRLKRLGADPCRDGCRNRNGIFRAPECLWRHDAHHGEVCGNCEAARLRGHFAIVCCQETLLDTFWLKLDARVSAEYRRARGCQQGSVSGRYSKAISSSLDWVHNVAAQITIRENTKPRFLKPWAVLFALQDKVFQEPQRMEYEGIIQPVKLPQWATPSVIALKRDGCVWF